MRYRMKNQLLCLAIAIAAMCPNMVLAQTNPNPSVTPIHGNNYGEWTAKWWQWLLAVPTSSNPNLDTTGANCGTGQSGSVWFLSGTFPGTEGPPFNLTSSVTRTCTVPKGKSLLLPLPNTVFGAGTGDCETPVFNPIPCREYRFGDLKDVPALHAAAAALGIDPIDMSTITVTLDSVPITNLASYRAASARLS